MKMKNLLSALLLIALPQMLFAQASPYAAMVMINGRGITYYEIDQRERMLEVLGTAGDLKAQAYTDLVDDRLREQAARAMAISISEDDLNAGMTEFAARANLSVEDFLAALAQDGVAPETFRDFVRAGLAWRAVVQTKYQARAFVSEAELDAALSLGANSSRDSVLISELIMPLTPGNEAQAEALIKDLSSRLRGLPAFEEAVRAFSAAPSRAQGGKLDWLPLSNLPPQIATTILTLNVGEISPPIKMPNALALFQLRGIRQDKNVGAKVTSVDYVRYLMPGGRSVATLAQARLLVGSIDTCEDLRAKAEGQPEERFQRDILPMVKIPRAVGLELAKLDINEVSTALTSGSDGQFLSFIMLCGRSNALEEGAPEQVRQAMFNQRLEAYGTGFLQELKSDAIIIRK